MRDGRTEEGKRFEWDGERASGDLERERGVEKEERKRAERRGGISRSEGRRQDKEK